MRIVRKPVVIFTVWIPLAVILLTATTFTLLRLSNSMLAQQETLARQNNAIGVNEYHLYASVPEVLGTFTSIFKTGDARPEILRKFFKKYNSDLVDYSDFFVQTADTYNLDFRLLPAIAMQESNLCKKIPEDSYNCWGFGIYGDKVTKFKSYDQAIETVAKTLRAQYNDKGLLSAEEIQSKYTPTSNGSWASSVNHFMEQMR
ncbi:glucosaminidase domain-containing protein [Candidatus Gottesmanbacteria bacterium]|nr:glucosaminidase domain-containing protein [Candidatus Gottesmanbacteria bacterium]